MSEDYTEENDLAVDAGEDVVMYSDPNVVIRRIGESTIPVINEIATIMGVTDEELIDRSNGYFKYGNVFISSSNI